MGLITDRTAPRDIPSADSLRDLPDDILGSPPPPAYLVLGTSPYAVDTPPERGEERIYAVRLICHGKAEKDLADGKVQHKRVMHCVKMWPVNEPEPEDVKSDEELAAENQPPLYGDDMEPSPEASGVDINEGVDRPGFSHQDGE